MSRFERQTILPGFGADAQRKLQDAKVLLIGAGGLGCPILLYLAAMGVGKIGLMDGDEVSLSNLNRQVLYGEKDLGKPKVEAAASYFRSKYSDLEIEEIPEYITVENALEILPDYDLVIDGSDNFPTRYLVNDACVLLGKPLVFGAVYLNEGQVSVFNLEENACNYRDVYPQMPAASEIPNCAETGVLGVLPGIIGNLMALEAIKVLTGFGKPLKNKMLFFNSLSAQTYEVEIFPNPTSKAAVPSSKRAFSQTNYELACEGVEQVDWQFVLENPRPSVTLVDVRDRDELPRLERAGLLEIPLSQLSTAAKKLEDSGEIYLFCQSGMRSQTAALQLKGIFPDKKIYSIRGGIKAFPKQTSNHG
ncbi:HesA/MoeB/ThiF family protein [Algoriphagus sp. H41]|uniref:HesA/MoeB/ThiF family protein n=1 Tax=Algoriphagus oliviformis TaxID=2811231 RepID=A0ABS3C9B9_9BACT|nr:HesA/MoeB/ThiF family protein [Algoriphagus oliviformis]MBN7812755.1 HesA/MoeB/ThiF family protein [Algoriphagus oliviformis]